MTDNMLKYKDFYGSEVGVLNSEVSRIGVNA